MLKNLTLWYQKVIVTPTMQSTGNGNEGVKPATTTKVLFKKIEKEFF